MYTATSLAPPAPVLLEFLFEDGGGKGDAGGVGCAAARDAIGGVHGRTARSPTNRIPL